MFEVCRPLRRFFLCLLLLVAGQGSAQTVPTTTVQDTVYRADGTPAQGTLLISWPDFTTSGGQAIGAGTTSVSLGAGGALSVALVSNANATPPNTVYTVVYQLDDGTVKTEYWIVPTTSPATLAMVRTTLGATTSVAQMATQQYVNAAVATKANDSAVVHLSGTETITGVKQFAVSPSLPTPVQSTDAATKGYVDTSVQNVGSGSYLSTSGGTMTGPLTLSGDPAAPNQAATKHYTDISTAVKADLVGGFVPASELAAGTPSGSTCLLGNQTWGACGAGSNSLYINSNLVANPNFNSVAPAAQNNFLNCSFQNTAGNVSLECPYGNTSSTFALGSQAVLSNQANTYGGGLQDFTAASLKLPSGAGYAPAIAGAIGFDTTANAPVVNISGVTQQLALTTSNISGQANTALALAATPTQCSGSFATGIQANGNANCSTADVVELAETTQPSGIPNYGIFWFDSATHTPRVIDNNGQVVQLALMNVFNSDANTLEEYNGATPQTFNIYRTRTDAADYERIRLGYDSADTYFFLGADAAGTGAQRGLGFWLQGALRWVVDSSFNFKPWSDNTKDIGASTLRVHNLYLGTGLVFNNGTLTGVHGSTGIAAEAGTLGTTAGAGLCNDGNGNVTDQGCTSGTVTSVFGRSGVVVPQSGDYSVGQVTGAAPLASPTFTGTPQAPTASALTSNTQIATTAYTDSAVAVEKTRAQSAEALLAPLASPTFTGTPTAPTPATSDNSTKIATTAWVNAQGYGSGGSGITNGVAAEPYTATGATTGSSDPTCLSSTIYDPVGSQSDRAAAILATFRSSPSNTNSLHPCVDARGEVANATGSNGTINAASSMFPVNSSFGGTDKNGALFLLPPAVFSVSTSQLVQAVKTTIKGEWPADTTGSTYYGSGFIASSSFNAGSGVSTSTSNGWSPGVVNIGSTPGQLVGTDSYNSTNPSAPELEELTLDANSQPGIIPLIVGTSGDQANFHRVYTRRGQSVGMAIGLGGSNINSGDGFPDGYFNYNGACVAQPANNESSWQIVAGSGGFYYLVITYSGTPSVAPQPGMGFMTLASLGAGAHYTIPAGYIGTIAAVSNSSSANAGNAIGIHAAGVINFTSANQFAVLVHTLVNGGVSATVNQTDSGNSTAVSASLLWQTNGEYYDLSGDPNWVFNTFSDSASNCSPTVTGSASGNGTTMTFTIGSGSLPSAVQVGNWVATAQCNPFSGAWQVTGLTSTTFTVASTVSGSASSCSVRPINNLVGWDGSGQGAMHQINAHHEMFAYAHAFGINRSTSGHVIDGLNCADDYTCVLVSSNFQTTNSTVRNASCTTATQNIVVDQQNGNTLTCANNPFINEYALDASGTATCKACVYESGFQNGWIENGGAKTLYKSGSAVETCDASGNCTFASITDSGLGSSTQLVESVAGVLTGTMTLPSGTTATTQSAKDGSTKLATDAYADAEVIGASNPFVPWPGYITASSFSFPTGNTMAVFRFSLPYAVTTSKVFYETGSAADNTSNTYAIGVYNSSGTLVLSYSAAGSTFAAATSTKYRGSWSQGSTTLPPGAYYLAVTSSCSSSCANFYGGASTATYYSNTAFSITTGGTLPGSITAPGSGYESLTAMTLAVILE